MTKTALNHCICSSSSGFLPLHAGLVVTKDENVSFSVSILLAVLWRCVWRIRGRWRLCASVTASCACVSLNVWEYTWPSNQRQQEQRQPRFTIISCTFFSSLPLCLSHSIPHLFKQLITSGNFPDVLREKRLTSCRRKQLSKVQNPVTIYQLDGSTHFFKKARNTKKHSMMNRQLSWWELRSRKLIKLYIWKFLNYKKGYFSAHERTKFCFLSL